MELDQEKQNQEAAERCRALAQRIVRELAPRSVQVLENSGLLEEAFDKMNTTVVQSSPELLVVADPQWVTLPAVQAEKVVLVCDEYTGMADCAKQLAAQGFCREFAWKDSGKEQLTALFCRTAAPELPELETGYEQQLDILRERTVQAERTAAEQAAQLERLRSDLSLSRSHEQDLEKTLNSVVNSTFWRASWPLRYLVSKCRQLWRSFPLFVFFATLRRVGFAGVMAQAKAKREYKKLFPGKAMPADRFADVELLVKQAADQPAAPRISIVVPLYNTPHDFLVELLDSVQNQTYRNWELCMVDAGQDADVGVLVQERARTDSRIRYRKLDSNEGIAGNTNQGFALATGEYIALLDHDDILHPCALWYVAEAIAKQGADFVYTDEVTFEGDIDHLTVYHFKPDYMLDNLRSNNYICHLSVFSAALLAKVGGDERAEFNGSQDYDLYLRLTEQAEKIVHIPHLLYYWRSSPASVASNISAKTYCLEAAMKALRAHYDRMGVPVDAVTMVPNTPGFYKTDYTITKPGRVSVLIPSCDHSGDLRVCVESIYRKTTYPDFEVIIIENNSKEACHLPLLRAAAKGVPGHPASAHMAGHRLQLQRPEQLWRKGCHRRVSAAAQQRHRGHLSPLDGRDGHVRPAGPRGLRRRKAALPGQHHPARRHRLWFPDAGGAYAQELPCGTPRLYGTAFLRAGRVRGDRRLPDGAQGCVRAGGRAGRELCRGLQRRGLLRPCAGGRLHQCVHPLCAAVPLREQEPRLGREPGQAQALCLRGGALPEAVGKAAGCGRPLHEPQL